MIVTLVTMVITNIIIMILIRRIYINWSLLSSDPGVLHNWFHFPSHLFQELHNLLSIEGYKSVQKISTMIFLTIPFQNSFNYYYRTRVRSLASLVTHSVTNSLLFSKLDGFEWCQLPCDVVTVFWVGKWLCNLSTAGKGRQTPGRWSDLWLCLSLTDSLTL